MYNIRPIYDSFSGGLVTKFEPNKLDDDQSPDIINVNFSGRNSFQKRRGTEPVGNELAGPGFITSIHTYLQLDGTQILMRGRDTALEELSGGTWSAISGSPTYTADQKFGLYNFRNVVYGGNAVEDSFKWDGTTYTALTTKNFPKGNIFADFQGRLFVAGVTNFENRVFYSKLSDVEDFQAAGTPPDVGGEVILDSKVTSIIPRNDTIVVHTLKKVFTLEISETTGAAIINEVSGVTGAIAPFSTVVVENDIFSVDEFGNVRSLGNRVNYNELRSDVQSVVIDKTTQKLDVVNSAAQYFNREYIYAAASKEGEANDVALLWDADYGSWKSYQGILANDFTIYQNKLVYASSVSPNVYQLNNEVYADGDDGSIFMRYSSPNFTFNDAMQWKRMRRLKIKGFISENAIITVRIVFDNNYANAIVKTFSGNDTNIVDEDVSITYGNVIYSGMPFGAYSTITDAVPVRPFLVNLSLGENQFYEARIIIEESGANTDFIVTHYQPFVEMEEEPHFEPARVI